MREVHQIRAIVSHAGVDANTRLKIMEHTDVILKELAAQKTLDAILGENETAVKIIDGLEAERDHLAKRAQELESEVFELKTADNSLRKIVVNFERENFQLMARAEKAEKERDELEKQLDFDNHCREKWKQCEYELRPLRAALGADTAEMTLENTRLRTLATELVGALEKNWHAISLIMMLSDRHFEKGCWVNMKQIHTVSDEHATFGKAALTKAQSVLKEGK